MLKIYKRNEKIEGILKEVQIKPMGSTYKIIVILEKELFKLNFKKKKLKRIKIKEDIKNYIRKKIEKRKNEIKRCISIDLGINQFATITNNIGIQPIIINGKPLKSINQFYNKLRCKLTSELDMYISHGKKKQKKFSKKLEIITRKRNNKIKDFIHKSS